MWIRGGGAGMWSEECKKALIACGINPEKFGTYDERAKAQSQARQEYAQKKIKEAGGEGKKHEPPCKYGGSGAKPGDCTCFRTPEALDEVGGDHWITLNSQSGHLSRNTFYQGEGARADPCSNVRPSPGNSGAYGYRDNDALCMDHAGLYTGMEHYEICRREQRQGEHVGDGPMPTSPKNPPDGTSLREGVEGSARIVVNGTASRREGDPKSEVFDPKSGLGKMSELREERGDRVDEARDKAAAELKAKEAEQAGKAGKKDAAKAQKPNSPSGGRADEKTRDLAVKCISDAWQASLKEMQQTAVTEYGSAGALTQKAHEDAVKKHNASGAKPKAKSYDDLPPAKKAEADKAAKDAIDARQKELEAKGAESAGRAGSPPPKEPTEKQCLEYQANWLAQHRDPAGNFPPMQGSGGPGPGPTTTRNKASVGDEDA